MNESPEKYGSSSTSRPPKITGGGKVIYSCIPACTSAFYNNDHEKTGIGFFKFPKEKSIQNTWKRIIKQYRRKGIGDDFFITPSTVVCEFHFETKDIKVSLGRGKKTLKPGTLPSIFSFKRKASPPRRKSPKKRLISSLNLKNYHLKIINSLQKLINMRGK